MSAGRRPAQFFRQTFTYALFAISIEALVLVVLFPLVGPWAIPFACLASLGVISIWIAIRGLAWTRPRTQISGPFVHLATGKNVPAITRSDGSVHLRAALQTARPLTWPPTRRTKALLFLFVGHPADKCVRTNFTADQIQAGLTAFIVEVLPPDAQILHRRADHAIAIDVDYVGPARIIRLVLASEPDLGRIL